MEPIPIDFTQLLEVYTLEEILERLELTPEDVLTELYNQGYFDTWENPLPLSWP